MAYPQLSGRLGSPVTPAVKHVAVPVVVAVVLAGGLLTVLFLLTRPQTDSRAATPMTAPTEVQPSAPAAPAGILHPTDDEAYHLASLRTQLTAATEQLGRAKRLIAPLAPALGQNGLWMERRRAEAAVTACENANQAVERALAELPLASVSKE